MLGYGSLMLCALQVPTLLTRAEDATMLPGVVSQAGGSSWADLSLHLLPATQCQGLVGQQ